MLLGNVTTVKFGPGPRHGHTVSLGDSMGPNPSKPKISSSPSQRRGKTCSNQTNNEYPTPDRLILFETMEIPEPVLLDDDSKAELEELVKIPEYEIRRRPHTALSIVTMNVNPAHVQKIGKHLKLEAPRYIKLYRRDNEGFIGTGPVIAIRVPLDDGRRVDIARDQELPRSELKFGYAYKLPWAPWVSDAVYLLCFR
ncbi:hypothetical protein BDDG_04040 [Blastomyces dermatitidis ATCC 18188]|nr:hypothetical protein BDDG_04040 [Blastomyces dermatitidis ATCC 18188]